MEYDSFTAYDVASVYKFMRGAGQISTDGKLNLENDEISKIVDIINEMKSNEDVLKRIEDASHYAWEHQGQAAKNVVDFLIKTQLEVSSEC